MSVSELQSELWRLSCVNHWAIQSVSVMMIHAAKFLIDMWVLARNPELINVEAGIFGSGGEA